MAIPGACRSTGCTSPPTCRSNSPARHTATSRNYLTDVWTRHEGDADGPITHPGWPANPVILYAIYDNAYRKEAGAWRIARSQIQFLWPSRITGEDLAPPPQAAALA